jgi:hypothetical protein
VTISFIDAFNLPEMVSQKKTVCVIGAGVSGVDAAVVRYNHRSRQSRESIRLLHGVGIDFAIIKAALQEHT